MGSRTLSTAPSGSQSHYRSYSSARQSTASPGSTGGPRRRCGVTPSPLPDRNLPRRCRRHPLLSPSPPPPFAAASPTLAPSRCFSPTRHAQVAVKWNLQSGYAVSLRLNSNYGPSNAVTMPTSSCASARHLNSPSALAAPAQRPRRAHAAPTPCPHHASTKPYQRVFLAPQFCTCFG